jgi:cytochrome oxidase assembly protein ShyY1
MLARSLLKRMSNEDRNLVKEGGIFLTVLTGSFAYFNYREYIKKDFLRSEGHYRFNSRTQNITPWKQLYFTWWRMPDEEFNVYHRFKPYFMLGQLDTSKEVLIPAIRYDEFGNKHEGYNVINPLYCYEGGRLSFANAFNKEDPIKVDRSAIIINRGWIPAELKDRRSRPNELNSRKLVKLRGVWRKGKNVHDYKIPNNPDNNEWHNLALEDIGIFWDLPNFDECKYYYFQVTDLDQGKGNESQEAPFPLAATPDQVIDEHYNWKIGGDTNKLMYLSSGALAAVSAAIAFIA